MRTRVWQPLTPWRFISSSSWFVTGACLGLTGCSSTLCALRLARAADELARAEQLDAARRAPYEYHYALEHLRKARGEALEADTGDAVRLAEIAQEYASRAVRVAQRVEPLAPVAPSPVAPIAPERP